MDEIRLLEELFIHTAKEHKGNVDGLEEKLKQLQKYRITQKGMPAVIAIDGRCGSGKTYLSGLIEKLFPCNVCHMDDFYMPSEQRQDDWMKLPGGNMDFMRFLTEVLVPVKAGKRAGYRPYDCEKNKTGKNVQMSFHKLTVVAGSRLVVDTSDY